MAFDALRPDMVTPERMPNLCRFASEHVRFSNSRSVFPTETRVNQASLVTGCWPARHGIVGNRFLDAAAAPGMLLDTADDAQLAAAEFALGGRLLDVPSLGEILAAAGKRLAVVGSGTAGGTRLLHHRAAATGGFRLALAAPRSCEPDGAAADASRRLGPIPPHAVPSLAWLSYATDVWLAVVEPALAPDVAILWYCEPDNSYHRRGLGSPDNLTALRRADAEFGRILDYWRRGGRAAGLQIITLSDHGQTSLAGARLNLAARLTAAGWRVGPAVADGSDLALAVDSAGGLYVRDRDADLAAGIVDWLQQHSWCGPVFTRHGRTALTLEDVGLAHRRAPDIALVLASDDKPNRYGVAGSTRHDSGYPAHGGLHGGLHRAELSNWLALGGSAFRAATVVDRTAGIVDILPTVLAVLGLPQHPDVDGRILREAFDGFGPDAAPPPEFRTHVAAGRDGWRALLSTSRVEDTVYLERGWVERGAGDRPADDGLPARSARPRRQKRFAGRRGAE